MEVERKLRLEITLKRPNEMIEGWLERWLQAAERKNSKSQYKLREALQSLQRYPLPLSTGRECAILRGFGSTLCGLIDEEIRQLRRAQPQTVDNNLSFQEDVQRVLASVKQHGRKRPAAKVPKAPKVTKKVQKALAEEEERQRQVTMSPGSFSVVLLVDTQETTGKNKRTLDQTRSYLESLAIPYEVRRLTVGDFLWVARDAAGNELVLPYIVERKRMDDLASSIRDGRFHEQKHRLRQCGVPNIVYLIEDYGDNEHLSLPLENLQQAMANTQIHSGFTIVHTENHWRSMVYLQGMTQALTRLFENKLLIGTEKEDLAPGRPRDRIVGLMKFKALYEDSARNAQLTVREVFVQQLLQLHSLSMEKSLAIVAVYPTPRTLLDAYDECADERAARLLVADVRAGELQRPIGEKLSQMLYDFYNTEFIS